MMNLTHRELEVLTIIVDYNRRLQAGETKEVSITELRKSIMSQTEINKNNLSKYVATFIDKNILKFNKEEQSIILNDIVMPILDGNEININIKLIIK